MIDINVTLFIQMANFFIFLILMNIILYRPIRRIVAERNALMEGKRKGIEQADADAAAAVAAFESNLQNARRDGRQKVQEFKEAAYRTEKELVGQAADEAAKYVQSVRTKIQQDIQVARDKLKGQVQAFSKDLAKKVLGRSI